MTPPSCYMSSKSSNGPASLRDLHDGHLLGIMLTEKQCTLFISDIREVVHQLKMEAVERLRADNFLQGNIVLDVTVETGIAVEESDVLYALSMDEDDAGRHRHYIDGLLRRIENGELCLVQLAPSYGCALTCLCANVTLDTTDRSNVAQTAFS